MINEKEYAWYVVCAKFVTPSCKYTNFSFIKNIKEMYVSFSKAKTHYDYIKDKEYYENVKLFGFSIAETDLVCLEEVKQDCKQNCLQNKNASEMACKEREKMKKEHYERLKEEEKDLSNKIEKLNNFIKTNEYNKIDEYNKKLLKKQLKYMYNYDLILQIRLSKNKDNII